MSDSEARRWLISGCQEAGGRQDCQRKKTQPQKDRATCYHDGDQKCGENGIEGENFFFEMSSAIREVDRSEREMSRVFRELLAA